MFKKIIAIILVFAIVALCLAGCESANDVLDGGVDKLNDDFDYDLVHSDSDDEEMKSVLDMLDFMLQNYISGNGLPVQTQVPVPDDQKAGLANKTTEKVASDQDLKNVLLEALKNTDQGVTFRADTGWFTSDAIYVSLFNDLCLTYIIDALGVNAYDYSSFIDAGTGDTIVHVTFHYFGDNYSLDKVKQMKKDTLKKAQQVVQSLSLNSLGDYEKVWEINKYLCETCYYPAGDPPYKWVEHSPYGTLINGCSVCEGYAKAAQLLMTLCGMNSYVVTGDTSGGGHAWNIVKVDGEYYQLDVTWNDVDSSPNMYFLVTDDYMSVSRTWDRSVYPASASHPYPKKNG